MKKLIVFLSMAVFMAGISGCGDNKTKEKLIGTSIVSNTSTGGTTSGGSYVNNATASSVTTLYTVSYFGMGAGGVSFAPNGRAFLRRTPSTDTGGLPTPNSSGEYLIDPGSGVNIKLEFKYSNKNVILKTDNVISSNDIRTFETQAINAYAETDLPSGITNFIAFFQDPYNTARYVPAMWSYADSGNPIGWYTITNTAISSAADIPAFTTALTSFIETTFPTSMVNTITGSIPGGGGTLSLTMTSAMAAGKPTDASPATMTGSGTITLTSGEVLTVTTNMSVGANGPISGTQSFTSSTGQSGVLTFAADGSMTGSISQNGAVIATISINANGTGTYTDASTGTVYSITGAKPA